MVTPSRSVYTKLWSLPDAAGGASGDSGIWRTTSSERGSIYTRPSRPDFETAQKPGPQAPRKGALAFAADVFIGAGEAAADTLVGAVELVMHPLKSLKNLATVPVALVTRPEALAAAFKEPFTRAIREGRPGKAVGRGLAEVGLLVFGGVLVGKGLSAVRAGRAAGKAAAQGAVLAGAVSAFAPAPDPDYLKKRSG